MVRRVSLMLMCAVLVISILGCAQVKAVICPNGPEVLSSLQSTVSVLKATADELNAILLKGYDAEIALAYAIAKTSLTAAEALLAQACPDPNAVAQVAATTAQVVVPKAQAARMKARKLGLI